jgi:hypothetical protein
MYVPHTSSMIMCYVATPSKVGGGNPHKYGYWWPYQVTAVISKPISQDVNRPRYMIRNLVTDKEYMVDFYRQWPQTTRVSS